MIRKYSKQIKLSAEYRAWNAMKNRCYSPSNNIGNYKDLNIQVCEEWRRDFLRFLYDMGCRPSDNHSLDRINPMEGYSKDNCRWALLDVQNRNKIKTKFYKHDGKSLILSDWAKELNMSYKMLHLRIARYGLSFEEAIMPDPFKKLLLLDGQLMRLTDWCMKYNIKQSNVSARLAQGWDLKKALSTPVKNIRKLKNDR